MPETTQDDDRERDGSAASRRSRGGLRIPVPLTALAMLALLLSAVLALTLGYLWNEDFWWYLATGDLVLERGAIPDHDLLLYTSTSSTGWPAHSWLWGVLLAALYRVAGLWGPLVLGSAVVATLVASVFLRAPVDRFGVVNALAVLLVIGTAAERLSLKAELATWLLMTIFVLLSDRRRPFTWRTFVALATLQWLWANLHAGYPLGIGVTLAFALGGWIEERWLGPAREGPPDRPPLWVPPALLAVSLLAPHQIAERLRMLGAVTEVTASRLGGEGLAVSMAELQPPFEAADPFYARVFLVAIAVAGIALIKNRRGGHPIGRLFLVAGTALLAYSAIRHVTALALAAALVTVACLSEVAGRRGTGVGLLGTWVHRVGAGALALLLGATAVGLVVARGDFEAGQSEGRPFVLSPLATCPGAAEFVKRNNLPGPIFNDLMHGGYLEHTLYPDRKLFIDNRILRSDLLRTYTRLYQSPAAWRAAERRYGFRTAVLSNLAVPSPMPLRSQLSSDPRWRMVYLDPLAVVFVRDGRGAAGLQIDPALPGGRVPFVSPASGPGAWLRRAAGLLLRTDASDLLHRYLSVLGELGRYRAVEELAGRALAVRPRDAALYRFRGAARTLLGKRDRGLEDLSMAVELRPDDLENRVLRARALADAGRRDEALRELARARRLATGRDPRIDELERRLRRRSP